jgi:hypothetical protein
MRASITSFSCFMVEQKLQNSSCGKGPEVNGNGGAFVDGGSGQNGVEAGDEAAWIWIEDMGFEPGKKIVVESHFHNRCPFSKLARLVED